jgi:peptidyl-prolyl cis-trans isomerase D
MSKRQTTGLPDKSKSASAKPAEELKGFAKFWDRLLGHPQNRTEREEAFNRLIIRDVTIITVVLGIAIAISVIYDQFIVPNQTVATVNGEAITVREFRDQVRFENARIANQINTVAQQLQAFGQDPQQFLREREPYRTWLNELNFPDQLGQRVLNDMIDNTLAEQQATALGVTVSEDAVQEQVNNFFGYNPTQVALTGAEPTATLTPTITPTPFVSPTPSPIPTNTPSPTPTLEVTAEVTADVTATPTLLPSPTPEPTRSIEEQQQDFSEQVTDYDLNLRQQTGVGQEVIDGSYRTLALQQSIGEYLLTQSNNQTTYVYLRHILVATQEEAQDVIAALSAGESFADLAQAVSTDGGSASNGGIYEWAPSLNYVDAFKDASETLTIGQISEPVETEFGFHVMQVLGRELRDVTEEDRDRVTQALYRDWIADIRTTNEANINRSDNWLDFMPQL